MRQYSLLLLLLSFNSFSYRCTTGGGGGGCGYIVESFCIHKASFFWKRSLARDSFSSCNLGSSSPRPSQGDASAPRYGRSRLFAGQFAGRLRPGSLHGSITPREVPAHIPRPEYISTVSSGDRCAEDDTIDGGNGVIAVLEGEDLERMRASCRVAREVLNEAVTAVRPGISTLDIDHVVHQACVSRGAYPSPLGFHGFPRSCCTSLNEVLCHGIPDAATILQDGDIINVDVTVFYKGFHGDCSETVAVGEISGVAAHLIASTRTAMLRGIAVCRPGRRYSEVGAAIEAAIAEANRGSGGGDKAEDNTAVQLRVVPGFCGHGIGKEFHAAPNVIHYARNAKYTQRKVSQLDFPVSSLRLRPGAPVPAAAEHEYEEYVKCVECGASRDAEMRPGHVFTVEPIVSAGSGVAFEWEEDGWTQTTMDGSIAAQFEHTVLITETGVAVLTE